MDIKEIFEDKIKIEAKVMSIDSLFYNPERVRNTDFQPSYQRNYVWDDEKASYFIESILLGTEIPPLVYFRNSDKIEVIDGRQRYQTILKYKNNELKLKKNGLHKLGNVGVSNKYFKDIDTELQDLFRETKLRIIEFSFHSRKGITDDIEEIVKKEIFKRYNSGITPLKPTEIDKAVYFNDDLNTFLKKKLQDDEVIYRDISSIFHFERNNNVEVILKKIRQLLVQHKIPIKYYSVKKQTIISKFYEGLLSNIDLSEIEEIYTCFIRKVNLLLKIKKAFEKNSDYSYNRLISETLFWGFSILENEEIEYSKYSDQKFIDDVVKYLYNNISAFETQRSSFSKELYNRYNLISEFLQDRFDLKLNIYLEYNSDFKQLNKDITPENEERVSFDDLRINKPEPSSIAIMDVCRQMERQKFLIRPPYQRNEVINQKKSSSIIESIILGIKLPPIFVFKRADGISEVLDGQQRLLSILAFIQKPYLDENNERRYSNKNGFALNLKNSILKNLHGKKFDQLSTDDREKIKNFDLWIIEIDYKNNKNFEPIDLFVRLNNKPYPIKDDTFEMWNSFISRDIVKTIKKVHSNHSKWFYFRKNNSRMEDENIYTALAYFQFCRNRDIKEGINELNNTYYPKVIDVYKVGNKINFRVKSKNEMTRVLENSDFKEDFIQAINHLEFDFVRKLKNLLSDQKDDSNASLSKNLDDIFMIGNARRTQQSFYALWYFLFNIPVDSIDKDKMNIRIDLKQLFSYMTNIEDKLTFEQHVLNFKEKYSIEKEYNDYEIALLGEIGTIGVGVKKDKQKKNDLFENVLNYKYVTKIKFLNFTINSEDVDYINVDPDSSLNEIFDTKSKILLLRNPGYSNRFNLAYVKDKLAFGNDIIGILLDRSGILSKYVMALLSSKYYYYKYFVCKTNQNNGINPLSISEVSDIEIPVLPMQQQRLFEIIVDCITVSETHSKVALFYERILDLLVYNIYFERQLLNSGINTDDYHLLFTHLEDIQNINKEIVENLYNSLSSPENKIGADLIRLMNIKEVMNIESEL